MQKIFQLPIFAAAFFLVSCGDEGGETTTMTSDAPGKSDDQANEPVPPEPKPNPQAAEPQFWSDVKLHAAIREKNPAYTGNGIFGINPQGQPIQISLRECGISDLSFLEGITTLQQLDLFGNRGLSDISPLTGMPLQNLYLENTGLKDISPLEGMQLAELYLSGSLVEDLTPLKKMAVGKLNLVQTPVEDLSPLEGVFVNYIWLTDTQVSDISPLAKVRGLESITLHRTKVEDLSPLARGQFPRGIRLHIGETPVTDLSTLAGVPLTRLVFSPDRIKKGLDVVRQIPSLREIGTQFEDAGNDLLPPHAFWPKYDAENKKPDAK
ncbi:MAG: hypothetical protein HKN23_08385 [Verrucomicrobiales bacterium]|nr:hypothetical protein [Verrucomicrobiales bacterium]